jgi:hypothetical protein
MNLPKPPRNNTPSAEAHFRAPMNDVEALLSSRSHFSRRLDSLQARI